MDLIKRSATDINFDKNNLIYLTLGHNYVMDLSPSVKLDHLLLKIVHFYIGVYGYSNNLTNLIQKDTYYLFVINLLQEQN